MTRSLSILFLALSVLGALFVIACGGDDDVGTANLYESCDTRSCDSLADACYTVAFEDDRDGTMCSRECDTSADCSGDAACFALYGDPSDKQVCFERCLEDRDCASGFFCADAERDGVVVDSICLPN